MIKKDRGVTLIALTITVIIILTITGMIVYSAKDSTYIKKLTNMQNDIANLRDKVSLYYSQYGDIPASGKYDNIGELQKAQILGANDTGDFYIIDLENLDGLTLNYGKDYEKYKNNRDIDVNTLTDIYIINKNSHNIFYVQGIRVKENNTTKIYYTDYTVADEEEVALKEIVVIEGVTIPDGFYYVGGTKNSGIVISDNPDDKEVYKDQEKVGNDLQGNQFVWVPVENFSEFTREHFGTSDQKWWTGTFVTDGLSANNLYEPVSDGTKDETEVDKMYKSVKENQGFYVGRYEAGTTVAGTGRRGNLVCKQEADVYNNIGIADTDDMTDETGGAVEVARGMYSKDNGDSVTSTLIYGVQWDAIMRWMKDEPNLTGGKYVQDSTDMGWYVTNSSSGNSDHKTGKDLNGEKNVVKNIYDLAGNVSEWTMENYNTSYRVFRGGSYRSSNGSSGPASNRNIEFPSTKNKDDVGFRVALYLNVEEEEAPVSPPTATIKEFTIAGVTYKFEEGMDFLTWINSKYNTGGWVVSPSSYITDSTYMKSVRDPAGKLVYYSTMIIENTNYTTRHI